MDYTEKLLKKRGYIYQITRGEITKCEISDFIFFSGMWIVKTKNQGVIDFNRKVKEKGGIKYSIYFNNLVSSKKSTISNIEYDITMLKEDLSHHTHMVTRCKNQIKAKLDEIELIKNDGNLTNAELDEQAKERLLLKKIKEQEIMKNKRKHKA